MLKSQRIYTVHGKIYTPTFSFFLNRVVNIAISELRPVSNESSDSPSLYRGTHKFFNLCIFKIHIYSILHFQNTFARNGVYF